MDEYKNIYGVYLSVECRLPILHTCLIYSVFGHRLYLVILLVFVPLLLRCFVKLSFVEWSHFVANTTLSYCFAWFELDSLLRYCEDFPCPYEKNIFVACTYISSNNMDVKTLPARRSYCSSTNILCLDPVSNAINGNLTSLVLYTALLIFTSKFWNKVCWYLYFSYSVEKSKYGVETFKQILLFASEVSEKLTNTWRIIYTN